MRLTKSYAPKAGSFLDCITMMAFEHTFIIASDMEVRQSKIATGIGSSKSLAKMTMSKMNYIMPMMTM